jgi:hypothetical protein
VLAPPSIGAISDSFQRIICLARGTTLGNRPSPSTGRSSPCRASPGRAPLGWSGRSRSSRRGPPLVGLPRQHVGKAVQRLAARAVRLEVARSGLTKKPAADRLHRYAPARREIGRYQLGLSVAGYGAFSASGRSGTSNCTSISYVMPRMPRR